MENENETIRKRYTFDYPRALAISLGGSISRSVRQVSPLGLASECDNLLVDLNTSRNEIFETKKVVRETINELIKAKKEQNQSKFNKIAGKFQEILENIAAKAIKEILKD
jgi:hypothetical protein